MIGLFLELLLSPVFITPSDTVSCCQSNPSRRFHECLSACRTNSRAITGITYKSEDERFCFVTAGNINLR
jgi:hypothetical protein